MGLNWIITYGDRDKDGLIDYALEANRQHGGLVVQAWSAAVALDWLTPAKKELVCGGCV